VSSGARARSPGPIVCLITDRQLVGDGSLPQVVAEAVDGGVTMVQLREKDLPTRDLLELASRLREVVRPPALLLVNGRADVAFTVQADGVHLPSDGLPIAGARAVLPEGSLIGRSAHRIHEVEQARADGADYVELGTVFASWSHPGGATIGVQGIQAAARIGIPLLAVGGITPENAADVIRAGANGVAVISTVLAAPDPGRAAERLAQAVREAWAERAEQRAREAPCSSR
jgi:thiamine-phosphate pyrophosphorylase